MANIYLSGGGALRQTLARLSKESCFLRPPRTLAIDGVEVTSRDSWSGIPSFELNFEAEWDQRGYVTLEYATAPADITASEDLVRTSLPLGDSTEDFVALLADLHFELASVGTLYEDDCWLDYVGPSMGDGHLRHGPFCAFRGDGHKRLVSWRWLEDGPWRTIHAAEDLTIIQFHELGVTAETALAQARPGHQRMGISDSGGFIHRRFQFGYDLKGLYIADKKQHKIIVHSREVTQREMLEAAAMRFFRRDDEERPVDSVAFVFAVPEAAQAHLHEMWLREIEVWTFHPLTGAEIRLDDTYEPPPPEKPEWIARLEAAEV